MNGSVPQVALFDLDGTLTWRDSFVQFLTGYLSRRPARWLRAVRLLPALASFAADRDRGLLKQRVIQVFMRGDARADIDAWAREFSAELVRTGMRREALAVLREHRERGDYIVLLSASPDLYVPRVGESLGVDRTICTEVRYEGDRVQGELLSPNRRGEEKLRVLESLRREFPAARFAAYGNADSDLAHLARVEQPLLVNATTSARRRAASLRIDARNWG